jgi:hypothetical protein
MHNPIDPSAARTGAPGDVLVGVVASELQSKRKVPPEFSRAREIRDVRRHNCYSRHRTFEHFANCAFRPVYTFGEGQFGSVSYCKGATTVHLFHTEAAARKAIGTIDSSGCGGLCSNDHELVRLVLS